LLGYGYTSVDQIYDPSASASQVTTNLNAGRGIINYCGHGSTTSWGTTGFSNTNVNALTNDFMLPHIVSVACLNGNFVSGTCFAEAWLRATNNTSGDPTGAIAMYASTVNQSWDPPMRAQDEAVDLLVAEAKHTIGGLWYNGSSRMMEVYTDGIQEFKNWHIFGDASILVRSADPTELTATYNPVLFLGMSSFQVETEPGARVALYGDGTLFGTGIVDPSGIIVLDIANPPMQPMDLTLTVTALNKVTHIGTVQALPASGPYVIINDMVITDDNNGIPEFGETINLNFEFDNVGNDPAQDVEVSLTTTDPYITILNPTQIIQNIAANGTASTVDGFDIQIATNIPDQHSPTVQVSIDVGTEVFEYSRDFVVNAPAFTWGGIMVDDFLGNNNGMIDPGESVTLSFPFTNSGHAQAT
ncbi:MAG: C25 family cysteine peptidase, partial [Candidatus Syntrophosphaera sp.]